MSIIQPQRGQATRRVVLGVAAGLVLTKAAQAEDAVSINVVDVAGNLALSQRAFEAFRKANPSRVNKISFSQAPARNCRLKSKRSRRPGGSTSISC